MEKVRFVGFNGPVVKTKVNKLLIERNEKHPENKEFPLMSFVSGIGVTPKSDRYNREFLVKEENKLYKRTLFGDFIYSSNNLTTGSIGLNTLGNASLSPVYSIFHTTKNASPIYIGYRFVQKDFINKMIQYRQGVVYGQWKIPESDFLEIEVSMPSVQEQEKIGGFLSSFDKLVQKQQDKIGLLKDLKKGYLQAMFPQKGANIPKIRFKGFTGAWEQRTIGDISKLVTKGTTPIDKSGDGTVNYVKVENIDPYSGEISNLPKISEAEHNGYLRRSQLQDGDILFSIAGTLGRISTVSNAILPANTNQALAIIRLNIGNIRFIQTALKGKVVEDFVRRNPTVGAQPNLSLEQVKSLIIDYPNDLEQSKIGTFFDKLDNLITLHQQKLERLIHLKQGYMQRLF